jgi:L-threonylcarbamoyladenylate synthase
VAVRHAAEALRRGEVVALPTETVYGLAANALNGEAVARIFEIKGRPAHNPLIVHVAENEMARRCAAGWPEAADKLAKAFWPGPLTLVLPKTEEIPNVVTASGPTVGLRWPSHPLIQAVIRECGFPLAAPSANLSNRISPTSAEHVRKQLGGKIPLIIDGGNSRIGIESTVVDVSVSPPRLLRPGIVHEQALVAVTGQLASGTEENPLLMKSPGMLRKHYAPQGKLVVWSWRNSEDLDRQCAQAKTRKNAIHVLAHTQILPGKGFGHFSVVPHDAEAFARALYAELHRCDDEGAELIVVEAPPDSVEWRAVADRLKRAAAE